MVKPTAPTEWAWRWRVFRVHGHTAIDQKWKGSRGNLDLATAKDKAKKEANRLGYTGAFTDWEAKAPNL